MIRFLQSGNKAAKYILGGFLLILAVSMVTYLIPGFMTDSSLTRASVIAKVDGEEISADAVNKAITAQLQQNRYPEQFRAFIAPRVLEQMIQRQEVRYEARRMGLSVSDQEVRDDLQQNPNFKPAFFPDGKWIGQEKYEEMVVNSGQTVADFERGLRDDLLIRKLVATITAGVTVSPDEIANEFKEKNTKVKFQYAVLNLADVTKDIKPTEAELKAFYETNLVRYKNSIPEKRQIRYFVLPDKEVEAQVTVTPSEITNYYTKNQNQYQLPDKVRLRRILISIPAPGPDGKSDPKAVDTARAKAADVLKQLRAGADFAELAKKYSSDDITKDKGGELGWIEKGQFPYPEAEKVAFNQGKGQISEPLQTPLGFDIIQTEDKQVAHVKPLSEVRDDIEKVLKAQKATAALDDKATKASATAQKDGLDKAAAQAQATVITSNPIARADALPGVGADPQLMATIFQTDVKSGPQLQRFPQGYILFEVARIDPAKTPSFEEIKDKVTTDFKNERGNELLAKKTQTLADRAHSEHDLAKAAKEAGATVKTSDLVTKSSSVPDLGSMSGPLGAAFTLKPGEISGGLNVGQKGVVLEVSDRQEPSTSDPQFAKERDTLQEQLTEQKRQEALQMFMTNLENRMKKDGKLKINENAASQLTRRTG